MPEERQRRFWVRFFISHEREINFKKGALAGHVISHVLGDETASPDAESTAENLHNAYAAMPEHRQRRFWVSFFICHPITWKRDLLKIYIA